MSTNQVDQMLALPLQQVGHALASVPEDQWFERKSARVAPKDLAVPLVALANAEGGTAVVGIHDGKVDGVRRHIDRVNSLRQAPLDHTHPPVRTHFDQVACLNSAGELDTILVARVSPGEVVHETTNGECYLRVGDESRRLSFGQRQELHYDRGSPPYDGQPVRGLRVDDLDRPSLVAYRSSAGASGSFTRLLQARSLLSADGEVSVAGCLLFAANPQEWFPHAHVRVLRYQGVERGTGRRLSLDDTGDVRIEGPLPAVIEKAADVTEQWVPRRRSLAEGGTTFTGIPIVPRDAWLEGLVNAVIHRSYSSAGDHIRVEIFPDRIEIESPGRFPGLIDPRRPLEVGRYARNPRIARVCADLRIGQELGEGIKRIFDEMRLRGLTDPVYSQTQGSVRLVLEGASRIAPAVIAALPKGSTDLLNRLRQARQPLGTGQLVDLAQLSRPTVKKQLAALREQGLVEWDGRSEKDPRAVWRPAD
ncbi:MAG: ATP-binding protein [Ornithinimicrobium sp.]|jgi:ATP-dependent DNA helicase RecG|uniref:ATP-binding protein n=1 Tax=Ornithinimicrobium sp. TaxID=1977084 RepID=UPI003D9AC909